MAGGCLRVEPVGATEDAKYLYILGQVLVQLLSKFFLFKIFIKMELA